jgi:hypothetical protein
MAARSDEEEEPTPASSDATEPVDVDGVGEPAMEESVGVGVGEAMGTEVGAEEATEVGVVDDDDRLTTGAAEEDGVVGEDAAGAVVATAEARVPVEV